MYTYSINNVAITHKAETTYIVKQCFMHLALASYVCSYIASYTVNNLFNCLLVNLTIS